MVLSCAVLSHTEAARSVRLLKVDGGPPYRTQFVDKLSEPVATSRWEVDGYKWETRFFPDQSFVGYMALELVFLSDAEDKEAMANVSCRLVDPSGVTEPSAERTSRIKSFRRLSDSSEIFPIMIRDEAYKKTYLKADGSVTIECTITVFKEKEEATTRHVPFADLHKDLGDLLRSEVGADVIFLVAGESIAAHKTVLAARSPVFKAQFFGGEMKDRTSRRIEVKEMEPAVFRAMLGFIYTHAAPEELDGEDQGGAATAMAQHLLVAADRYGLGKLKTMCERRITRGLDATNVAGALAVAERHGCSLLKARCIEFITRGTAENLAAIMASDGFKSLDASLLTELLMKAAHERIKLEMGVASGR